MNSKFILTLCLCLFIGSISLAGALSIDCTPTDIPAGGYPADKVISVPVRISGAQNLGWLTASVSGISGGKAVIAESPDFRNVVISDKEDAIAFYGNFSPDIYSSGVNTSGYTYFGSETMFFVNITPDGTEKTVNVTLTFDEIWSAALENQTSLYLRGGNSINISLPVNLTTTPPKTECYVEYNMSAVQNTPVLGKEYIIPVTISGDDIANIKFVANYNTSAMKVSIRNTTGTVGGRNGAVSVVKAGACTFDLVVNYSDAQDTLVLNLKVNDSKSNDITPVGYSSYPVTLFRRQVTYSGGNLTPEYIPESEIVNGSSFVVSPYRPFIHGYVFSNWDCEGKYISPGDKLNVTKNMRLDAQWIPLPGSLDPSPNDLSKLNQIIISDRYDPVYDINNDGECDIFDLVLMAQYVADDPV